MRPRNPASWASGPPCSPCWLATVAGRYRICFSRIGNVRHRPARCSSCRLTGTSVLDPVSRGALAVLTIIYDRFPRLAPDFAGMAGSHQWLEAVERVELNRRRFLRLTGASLVACGLQVALRTACSSPRHSRPRQRRAGTDASLTASPRPPTTPTCSNTSAPAPLPFWVAGMFVNVWRSNLNYISDTTRFGRLLPPSRSRIP